MDISVMCILIISAKIWNTYLLFVEQCMHLVYQEIHLKPFLYKWTIKIVVIIDIIVYINKDENKSLISNKLS